MGKKKKVKFAYTIPDWYKNRKNPDWQPVPVVVEIEIEEED